MKPQRFLFAIPGTKNLFDYDEIRRLKRKPEMVYVKDTKANKFIGKYKITEALVKYE